jgi:hypothetical protein
MFVSPYLEANRPTFLIFCVTLFAIASNGIVNTFCLSVSALLYVDYTAINSGSQSIVTVGLCI